jgi:hypothetical protein
MAKPKTPRFDTSFPFGANRARKPARGKSRRRGGGTAPGKSRRYFAGLHGS